MSRRRSRAAAGLAAAGVLLVVLPARTGGPEDGEKASRGQPYAGLRERPIRGLSPERSADLLRGRGAGYALAAELETDGRLRSAHLQAHLETRRFLSRDRVARYGTLRAYTRRPRIGSPLHWFDKHRYSQRHAR